MSQTVLLTILSTLLLLASCTAATSWQELVRQGRIASQSGDFDRAEKLIATGIADAKKGGVTDTTLADVYFDLAKCQMAGSVDERAQETFAKAIETGIAKWGPSAESLIPVYKEAARFYYRKKLFDRSEEAARKALSLEKECCGAESEKLLDSLNLVVAAACAQDRCADTEALLLRQLAIRRKHLGNMHPHVAVSLALLGEAAERKGRFAEARDYFKEALSVRSKVEPELVEKTKANLTRIEGRLKGKSP